MRGLHCVGDSVAGHLGRVGQGAFDQTLERDRVARANADRVGRVPGHCDRFRRDLIGRCAQPLREDNDNDGILDDDDHCPNEPEDKDGIEDEDGCPESDIKDRDQDGIADVDDQCPDEPEDKDGYQDEDGCLAS